jgi:hypothetical protein
MDEKSQLKGIKIKDQIKKFQRILKSFYKYVAEDSAY